MDISREAYERVGFVFSAKGEQDDVGIATVGRWVRIQHSGKRPLDSVTLEIEEWKEFLQVVNKGNWKENLIAGNSQVTYNFPKSGAMTCPMEMWDRFILAIQQGKFPQVT